MANHAHRLRRVRALCLAALYLCAVLLGVCIAMVGAAHPCTGVHCAACGQLHRFKMLLLQYAGLLLLLFAAITAASLRRQIPGRQRLTLSAATPVALFTRMNN